MDKIEFAFKQAVKIIEITNASKDDCIEQLKVVTIDTIDLAEQGEFVKEPLKTEFLIEHICNVACDYFSIKPEIFQSKTQKREIVFARQIAFYFAREYTKLSLAKIGEKIGDKDHTTVRHGLITVENLMETNKKHFKTVKEIRDKITGNERTEVLPKQKQNDYKRDSARDIR